MPYEYLDHGADIGIRATGDSLAEAFAEGAQAMFGVMADRETIARRESVTVHCEAPDPETLFVEFLNELLFQGEVHGLLFGACEVKELRSGPDGWHLEAIAWGEPVSPARHRIYTEVKAATYFGLKYFRQDGQHVIQCVLDV